MEKFSFLSRNKISNLPETAGVYCFKKGPALIYIGKAINIKSRARQHHDLIGLAEKIGYIKTDSEIDALILEARLIKKYQPKYNTAWRDDKNYFYVAATHEDFPEIFITHQPKNERDRTSVVGPFVDGKALKETLKILRKVFPYRTCKSMPKHACLWYQIKRCPAPCLFQSSLAEQIGRGTTFIKFKAGYRRNVQNLLRILQSGKMRTLKEMEREMKKSSEEKKFEEAGRARDQIASLKKVFSHAPVFGSDELGEVKPYSYKRAEAYDIANIQGKEATGAMVVFTDGEPDKAQYRQFKIKIEQRPNDIAMLKEVLERRLKHLEWPYPDLILIDGGRAQLNIAIKSKIRNTRSKNIEVMALAKRENELYVEGRKTPILLKTLPRETFNLILQLRDEAHRFARRYHHQLRKKTLLG